MKEHTLEELEQTLSVVEESLKIQMFSNIKPEMEIIKDVLGKEITQYNPWRDLVNNPDNLPKIKMDDGVEYYMMNTEVLITCKTESREPWVRKARLLYEDGTFALCEGKKTAWFATRDCVFVEKIDKWFDEDIQILAWKHVNHCVERPYDGWQKADNKEV